MVCKHDWRMYDSGFSQRYEYCYACDIKKSDWDRVSLTVLESPPSAALKARRELEEGQLGQADAIRYRNSLPPKQNADGVHDWNFASDICKKCGLSGGELFPITHKSMYCSPPPEALKPAGINSGAALEVLAELERNESLKVFNEAAEKMLRNLVIFGSNMFGVNSD